jgi:hypothetical protein
MTAIRLALCLGSSLALAGCAMLGAGSQLPDRIVMERGGLIPEGIEYDTVAGRFLVGSLADGTVYALQPDGSLMPFVVDAELVSSIGIEADEARDRLLIANADSAVFGGQGPGTAKLGIYRLATGARIAMVDLGSLAGAGDDEIVFVNDVTVDDAGNVYLTDTFMNVIYRVDPAHEASVFYRFEPTTALQLNGIVYHESGFLIVVAVGGQGLLYKVPLADPEQARPIGLSQPATGADGLVWSGDGRLIVVSNSSSSALAYRSDDGWETAELVGTASFEGQATTGAAVGNEIYVVQPHFNDAEPPVVLRADF